MKFIIKLKKILNYSFKNKNSEILKIKLFLKNKIIKDPPK